MTSLATKLSAIKTMLIAVNTNTFHYWRSGMTGNYIVWAEDGEDTSSWSDNHKTEQAVHGTIDLFTKTEFDSNVDSIQSGLNGIEGCTWRLLSVQFEEETKYIHYEWEFTI